MRAVYPLLLLAFAAAPALAQDTSKKPDQSGSNGHLKLQKEEQEAQQLNQRTERIHVEDAGSRIDELRIGGQTQSITVQPKTGDMPAYEVLPSDGVRNLPGSRNGSESTTGPRVWNVLKF